MLDASAPGDSLYNQTAGNAITCVVVIPPPLAMPLVDTRENRRNSRMVFFMMLVGCVSAGR